MKMQAVSDTRPLKVKALECAIRSISYAITPSAANVVYKRWGAFHDTPEFMEAVKIKQVKFKTKK